MQLKIFTILASFGLLAAATPNSAPQCTTGQLQCCKSVQSSSEPAVAAICGLLNIVLGPIGVPVGVTCSPVTIGAGGEATCSETLTCCEDTSYNGVVAVGCSPTSVSA